MFELIQGLREEPAFGFVDNTGGGWDGGAGAGAAADMFAFRVVPSQPNLHGMAYGGTTTCASVDISSPPPPPPPAACSSPAGRPPDTVSSLDLDNKPTNKLQCSCYLPACACIIIDQRKNFISFTKPLDVCYDPAVKPCVVS